jgi:hypothetical protein
MRVVVEDGKRRVLTDVNEIAIVFFVSLFQPAQSLFFLPETMIVCKFYRAKLERATRIEPATFSLGS